MPAESFFVFLLFQTELLSKNIKNLIVEIQNEIPAIELMPRKVGLEETCNYVFGTLRRSGKSYLMS